jgi:hypothetical protein
MENQPPKSLDVIKGREQGIGPLIGTLVILVLLAAGALYLSSRNFIRSPALVSAASSTEIFVYEHSNASTLPSASSFASSSSSSTASSEGSSPTTTDFDAVERSLLNF